MNARGIAEFKNVLYYRIVLKKDNTFIIHGIPGTSTSHKVLNFLDLTTEFIVPL